MTIDEEQERKKIEYIALAVETRWKNAPYALREKAGDKALAAMRAGEPMSKCIEAARQYLLARGIDV